MSVIENLIQIKKQSTNDDIVKMMDEVADYEKLSRSELFRDLTTSKVAQKKLPLLAKAYAGDLYALSLSTLAGHIIAHLEDRIPEVLEKPMETLSERDMKRMELMNKSLIPVFYRGLLEYDDSMEDQVVAIYSSERPNGSVALMIIVRDKDIVRDEDTYNVYQGYYRPGKKEEQQYGSHQQLNVYDFEEEGDHFSFTTYSLLGNNRYPFGEIRLADGRRYLVSMDYRALCLETEEKEKPIRISLRMEQRNTLNLCKTDPEKLGKTLLHWIHLYFKTVTVRNENGHLILLPYQIEFGELFEDYIGDLLETDGKKIILWGERGIGGFLRKENPETKTSDWIWLTKKKMKQLIALKNDLGAFGTEVLALLAGKEEDTENETITDDTGRGPSGDQTDTGTEHEEITGEI